MTLIPDALVGKQLELLTEILPKASRVAVLWNPDNPGNARASCEPPRRCRDYGLSPWGRVVPPRSTRRS